MIIAIRNGEIVVTGFDAIEAFKIACRIERDGVRFYTVLAEREQEPSAKSIFEYLAGEEKKHLSIFEDCLAKARSEHDESFEDDDLFACMDYRIFELYKDINDLEKLLADTKKALKLGVQVERRTLQFYGAVKKAIVDPATQASLRVIMNEEMTHVKKIGKLLKSVETNA